MSDFSIHPVYLSARAAIVAPERAIPVTIYATQKWLPRLGPERWCLVILLRSLSLDSKRRNDGTKRVTCSWRHLAELLDVHEETIASWLKHEPIPNDKPWRRISPVDEQSENLGLFIPRLRYAYETRNGKTRRVGFLLEVLMEDPVVPEDEAQLQKQIEILQMQQGKLGLETYRISENVTGSKTELPKLSESLHNQQNLGSPYVNQQNPDLPKGANPVQLGLHNTVVNPDNPDLPTNVKQDKLGSGSYVNQSNSTSPPPKSEDSGKNVNKLDTLIHDIKQKNIKKNLRRTAFKPIVELTETILNDTHSTGFFYKMLQVLYPHRLDLYVSAVRVALDVAQDDPKVNRGAVFVRALREFAEIAGVDLGLKRGSSEESEESPFGNLGSQAAVSTPTLSPPSANEAVWAETQTVLRRQMTQATYDAIIQGTKLLWYDENKYTIGVSSEMAKEWLESRLHDIVQRALSNVIDGPVVVEFELSQELG